MFKAGTITYQDAVVRGRGATTLHMPQCGDARVVAKLVLKDLRVVGKIMAMGLNM